MENILTGAIGIVGTIVGAIITYYLSYKNSKKNIVYNVILEQYKEFIRLKEKYDYDTIDMEVYQVKDLMNFAILDQDILKKKYIAEEMKKTLNTMQNIEKSISKIKKHVLNNQYILENNNIQIESIIKLTGLKYKNIMYQEIINYEYNTEAFNIDLLVESENKYINFINKFSENLINVKIQMEKVLFREKICYSFANRIKRYYMKSKNT